MQNVDTSRQLSDLVAWYVAMKGLEPHQRSLHQPIISDMALALDFAQAIIKYSPYVQVIIKPEVMEWLTMPEQRHGKDGTGQS